MTAMAKNKPSRLSLPRISDAEWAVMREMWRLKTATAKEVIAALETSSDWKPKTIQTLLTRLTRKGALASAKSGREYIFRPEVTEEECRLAASRSFLDRVFDGQIAPFVACFLEREKLTRKEIEELRELLEERKR